MNLFIYFYGSESSMCFFFLKKERKYVLELNDLCKNFEAKLGRWSGKLFLSYVGVLFTLHIFSPKLIKIGMFRFLDRNSQFYF